MLKRRQIDIRTQYWVPQPERDGGSTACARELDVCRDNPVPRRLRHLFSVATGASGKGKVSLRNCKRAVVCFLDVAIGVCGTESRRDEITAE